MPIMALLLSSLRLAPFKSSASVVTESVLLVVKKHLCVGELVRSFQVRKARPQCSGVAPGSAEEAMWGGGLNLASATCKASTLKAANTI